MLSGCSFALMKPVPRDHAQQTAVDCTDSRAFATADLLRGTLNATGATIALMSAGPVSPLHIDPAVAAAVGIGMALISLPSAVYGFHQARRCEAAKDELQLRLASRPAPERSPGEGECLLGP
jgi:hypothetical protein